MAALMFDRYLPYSPLQILAPFLSPYRPFWVGIGVISFYLIVLVTVTFYLRTRIGVKTFRSIHYLSLLAYLGVTIHGLFSGTDSPLPMVMAMYGLTFLVVIFLTAYWLIGLIVRNQHKNSVVRAQRAASINSNIPGRINR
jgi:predicted ferric reductase